MKKIFLFIFLGLFSFLEAEELSLVLKKVLETDSQLALLKTRYEKALLQYTFAERPAPLSLTFSTGSQGLGFEWDWTNPADSFVFYLSPQLTLYTGESIGTKITINLSYHTENNLNPEEFSTSVSVIQELNRLLGFYHKENSTQLQAYTNLEKTRFELQNRSYELQAEVLQALQVLYQAQGAIISAQLSFLEAEKKYQELQRLQSYSPTSPSYKLIVKDYEQAFSAKNSAVRRFNRLLASFNEKYSLDLKELPKVSSELVKNVPDLNKIDLAGRKFINVYLAELNQKTAFAKLKELQEKIPSLAILANYANHPANLGSERNQEISGGFSIKTDDFQASLLSGLQSVSNTFFIKFTFSFTLPDFLKNENELKAAFLEVQQAQFNVKTVMRESKERFLQLKDNLLDGFAELEAANYACEIKELEFLKAEQEVRIGLLSPIELDKAELAWEMQKINLQITVLNLMLNALEFQKLFWGEDYEKNNQ